MKLSLPTVKEWQQAFDVLSRKEKLLFIAFFAAMWLSGIFILIDIDRHYSTKVPAEGGELTEGIVGTPSFVNPLLAVSDADRDITRIVYAGLMRPDGKGGLEGQLAQSYEISADGLTYTFHLRDRLYWQDNQKLTADDVVFTINLAKNPKIASPKRANWEGITAEAPDERTIVFHLKKPYAPFLENTTLGILPKHLWEKVNVDEFNLSQLNTHPVGSGPFMADTLTKTDSGSISKYVLIRFRRYQPAPAYLDKINLIFYPSEEALGEDLKNGALNSASQDLSPAQPNHTTLEIGLPRIFGVFWNQDQFKPLKDPALREALSLAVDRERIVREAENGHAVPTSLPIPPGTFAYASVLENTARNVEQAKSILAKAGYKDTDGDGVIEKPEKKGTMPIRLTLSTSNAPELIKTANLLKEMWKEIGVEVTVRPYEIGDLEQSIIRPRNYDALLFGQIVGYDPDPFAFWHTSQRKDPGLNVALYANTHVDKLLEDARTTIDPTKRERLYNFFQEEITKDKPAVFLYSPLYLYTLPKNLAGLHIAQIPLPAERFSQIELWYKETKNIWNIFLR